MIISTCSYDRAKIESMHRTTDLPALKVGMITLTSGFSAFSPNIHQSHISRPLTHEQLMTEESYDRWPLDVTFLFKSVLVAESVATAQTIYQTADDVPRVFSV